MAFTRIPPTPLFPLLCGSATSPTAFAMNSNDDSLTFVFYWPAETGAADLTKCAILCTAASGSPVVTAQLFNTDATDGGTTPVNTGSAIGSAVDSGTLVANTPAIISGIGQTSLPAGIYALRIIFKSGTSCSIAQYTSGVNPNGYTTFQFPFTVTVTNGGAQTKVMPTGGLNLGLGGTNWNQVDSLIGPGRLTFFSSFGSGSNPDEYGIWFTNPSPCHKRICGVSFHNISTSRPDIHATIYSGSLASPTQEIDITYDRDLAGTVAAGGANWFGFPASSWFTLEAGATIGIGIRASTTQLLTFSYMDFLAGNQALMDTFLGQNVTVFTREGDAGALTQVSYKTPFLTPIINGEESASSGAANPFTSVFGKV